MNIKVNLIPKQSFTGFSSSEYPVSLRSDATSGLQRYGCSSEELIFMGLGSSCTVAVIHTLHKSKVDITECRTRVTTTPEEIDLINLRSIHLHFDLTGAELTEATITPAINLSVDEHCDAATILRRAGIDITHSFALHSPNTELSIRDESSISTLKTLGIHHIALTSTNYEASRIFYSEIMKMHVEWEPDSNNVYLTNGNDNLAIHRGSIEDSNLDHIGFILNSEEEVDQWYAYLRNTGIQIEKEPKTHRDGARSFYVRDPDGVSVQLIYHPPLSRQGANL